MKFHQKNPHGTCFGYKTHHAMPHIYPTNINSQSFPIKCIIFSTWLQEIPLYYSLLFEGSLKASQFPSRKFYQFYLSQTLTSAEHLRFQEVFAAVPEQKALLSSFTISPSSGVIKKIVHAFQMQGKMEFPTGNPHWHYTFCCMVWNYLISVSSTEFYVDRGVFWVCYNFRRSQPRYCLTLFIGSKHQYRPCRTLPGRRSRISGTHQ